MRSQLHIIAPLAVLAPAALLLAMPSTGRAAAIDVTNDPTHRYGEVQIAVNPKNPQNIVYTDVEGGETYACQKEKRPECEAVQSKGKTTPGRLMSPPRGFFTDVKDFTTIGVFASFDGGKTWRRATIPVPSKAASDPDGHGRPVSSR